MGEILGGLITAAVLCVGLGLWRRHHQNQASPVERLVVGLLLMAGGLVLACLVVFVEPAIPAFAWTDIVLIVVKLATLIAGLTLALGGISLATTSARELRSPRE